MKAKQLNRNDLEGARAEVYHMILFAMAWVMIGEYSWHFRDYVVAAVIVITAAVILGLQSIKLYELEDELPEPGSEPASEALKKKKRFRLYVGIFLFEGVAIMATWMTLLHLGREEWLVPAFALVAGLHFLPLARVTRISSYYMLGAWICALAVTGYWLLSREMLTDTGSNVLIAYGCAAGAIADGIWIVVSVRKNRQL
ncbi:MAG TPA: hypothetical protein VG101_03115 [Puia sp.]|jgi:hypothetical protein|nr:hypothetical protein [Puia sp.]